VKAPAKKVRRLLLSSLSLLLFSCAWRGAACEESVLRPERNNDGEAVKAVDDDAKPRIVAAIATAFFMVAGERKKELPGECGEQRKTQTRVVRGRAEWDCLWKRAVYGHGQMLVVRIMQKSIVLTRRRCVVRRGGYDVSSVFTRLAQESFQRALPPNDA